MTPLFLIRIFMFTFMAVSVKCWENEEVFNFHFHTLWFQSNNESEANAMALRQQLLILTSTEKLKFCSATCNRACQVNKGPFAEYPIASFGTCCNKSSVTDALAFFAMNRGHLSVFVHPTTKHPLKDHRDRGMWLGPSMPLDLSNTPAYRDPPLICK